jgi:hypothetical protein
MRANIRRLWLLSTILLLLSFFAVSATSEQETLRAANRETSINLVLLADRNNRRRQIFWEC